MADAIDVGALQLAGRRQLLQPLRCQTGDRILGRCAAALQVGVGDEIAILVGQEGKAACGRTDGLDDVDDVVQEHVARDHRRGIAPLLHRQREGHDHALRRGVLVGRGQHRAIPTRGQQVPRPAGRVIAGRQVLRCMEQDALVRERDIAVVEATGVVGLQQEFGRVRLGHGGHGNRRLHHGDLGRRPVRNRLRLGLSQTLGGLLQIIEHLTACGQVVHDGQGQQAQQHRHDRQGDQLGAKGLELGKHGFS
mmetsp:Transcript_7818/g.14715  ORF Transcript_7818/g.14715 Transcript_7818/m.14715 type:complete len:250 (-) Transcript_7818:347-1096(-)